MDEEFSEIPERPSKSQRKREAQHVREMAEALAGLPRRHLLQVELPETVQSPLLEVQQMRADSARKRLLARIAKLMRDLEPDALHQIDMFLMEHSPRYGHRHRR